MMAPRKGFRRGLGRRRRPRSRQEEVTQRTREEARALSRERRIEARRRMRAQSEGIEEVGVRVKGAALEGRRLLRPVLAPLGALLSWIAPYVTRGLLFVIQLIAALIALVLVSVQQLLRWLGTRAGDAAVATAISLERTVTPLRTVAFVGAAAAVALGVSQFFDYHGVAVDAPGYAGEIGSVAPVPITGTETAGSAHLWLLLPLAAVALLLIVATYRGRTRLAGAVSLCGVLGIAVALAIDLPQGLDVGRPGLAFSGAQAVLLEGFWAEIASSAVLILCGGLLAHYSRGMAAERRGRRGTGGPNRGRRRTAHQDVGGMSPGLQAES